MEHFPLAICDFQTKLKKSDLPSLLYTCQKPGMDRNYCLFVIHRELQNVVYMTKNRCSRKRGEGPVLWARQADMFGINQ
jgi:hypothetical protein